HYQPIIDLKSGVVNEVEALVRWHHPSRGFIMPDDFIYLAEELGAVVQIGEIVLRKACRQLREWQLANIKVQRIAVNISNTQIREINFSELIAEILRETELPPESLVLELTESVLLADVEQNIEVLQKLKKIGISIAVDHFGSGYSSLSYLKHFPIDILKIDRSFINDIDDGQHNIGVLTAVAVLARSFHLKTVAEGIETIEQLRCLCDLNIDAGQGFLISKALPPDELIKGLKSGTFHYDAMHTTD
ncbi:MAG: EAL domain-containing protein (putative c-di-GMP-specific phosphodiesterase class I), partial [Paraglaciecola sp.]